MPAILNRVKDVCPEPNLAALQDQINYDNVFSESQQETGRHSRPGGSVQECANASYSPTELSLEQQTQRTVERATPHQESSEDFSKLHHVLRSPLSELRKHVRDRNLAGGEGMVWSTSSQQHIYSSMNGAAQASPASRYLKDKDKRALSFNENRIRDIIQSTNRVAKSFDKFEPAALAKSPAGPTALRNQPHLSMAQSKRMKSQTYCQRQGYLSNQKTFFNKFLSPAQKRSILVTHRHMKALQAPSRRTCNPQRTEQFPPLESRSSLASGHQAGATEDLGADDEKWEPLSALSALRSGRGSLRLSRRNSRVSPIGLRSEESVREYEPRSPYGNGAPSPGYPRKTSKPSPTGGKSLRRPARVRQSTHRHRQGLRPEEVPSSRYPVSNGPDTRKNRSGLRISIATDLKLRGQSSLSKEGGLPSPSPFRRDTSYSPYKRDPSSPALDQGQPASPSRGKGGLSECPTPTFSQYSRSLEKLREHLEDMHENSQHSSSEDSFAGLYADCSKNAADPIQHFRDHQEAGKYKYVMEQTNMKQLLNNLDYQIKRQKDERYEEILKMQDELLDSWIPANKEPFKRKKTFLYRNHLAQSKQQLSQLSGGIPQLYRRSTIRLPAPAALQSTKSAGPEQALQLEQQATKGNEFNLEEIIRYQQSRDYCEVRDRIRSRYLEGPHRAGGAALQGRPNPKDSKPQEVFQKKSSAATQKSNIYLTPQHSHMQFTGNEPEAVEPKGCEHHLERRGDFQINIEDQYRKAYERLEDAKGKKEDNRKIFDAILDMPAPRRTSKKAVPPANPPDHTKRETISRGRRYRDDLALKDEEGIFNLLQIKLRDVANEEIKEEEEFQRDLLQIGNSHRKHISNYGANGRISVDKELFTQLVLGNQKAVGFGKQEAAGGAVGALGALAAIRRRRQKQEKVKKCQFGIEAEIAKLTKNNVDFAEIVESQELMSKDNISKLRALRDEISRQKAEKKEQKQDRQKARFAHPEKQATIVRKKTIGDILAKAYKASLPAQLHDDQTFQSELAAKKVQVANQEEDLLLQKSSAKQQYYNDVKRGILNPESIDSLQLKYFTDLMLKDGKNTQELLGGSKDEGSGQAAGGFAIRDGNLTLKIPHFCNIQNGVLSLVNKNLQEFECDALKNYLQNSVHPSQDFETIKSNMIKVLIIDDLSMTDGGLLKIIQGVQQQSQVQSAASTPDQRQRIQKLNLHGCLEQIILMGVELSAGTIDFLISQVLCNQKKLDQLTLSNLKHQRLNVESYQYLFEALAYGSQGSPVKLKRLKFTRMDIHDEVLLEYLTYIIGGTLEELDLSWTSIGYSLLPELGEAFLGARHLKSLNLSYVNLQDFSNKQYKRKDTQEFIDALTEFIETSEALMHLNLNGMGLDPAQLTQIVQDGIAKSKTLVGVHLSGNNINEGDELRSKLCRILGIHVDGSMSHFDKSATYQEVNKKLLPKVTQLLKTEDYHQDLINQQIHNLFQQDRSVHQAASSGQSAWSGAGMHPGSRADAKQPALAYDNCFIVYRRLGHPELICDRYDFTTSTFDFTQADEQWQLNTNHSEVIADECYFCEKHKYLQVYYSRKERYNHYERVTDDNLLSQLQGCYKKTIDLCHQKGSTSPVLLSSFCQNWQKPCIMLHVMMLAAYLLQPLVLEANAKSKHLEKIEESVNRELVNLLANHEHADRRLQESLKEQMVNWRTTFSHYLKYKGQFDCLRLAYPLDDNRAGEEVSNTTDSESLASSRKSVVETESWAESSPDQDSKDIYVFINFVKPGHHGIIVYDPVTQEFFKKTYMIPYRSPDPCPYLPITARRDPVNRKHTVTSLILESLKNVKDNEVELKAHFSVKPGRGNEEQGPARRPTPEKFLGDSAIYNFQQTEFWKEICEEELAGLNIQEVFRRGVAADILDVLRQRYHEIGESFFLLRLKDQLREFVSETFQQSYEDDEDTNMRRNFLNHIMQVCKQQHPTDDLNAAIDRVANSFGAKIQSLLAFRRIQMAQDHVYLHKMLQCNMDLLELIHQVYTPDASQNLRAPNALTLIQDLDLITVKEMEPAKGAAATELRSAEPNKDLASELGGADPGSQLIAQTLSDQYEGLLPEELIQLCKTEKSRKYLCLNYNNDLGAEKLESPAELKENKVLSQIETIELFCRIAFVLGLDISDFIESRLVGLLKWKHEQVWNPRSNLGPETTQLKKILPKTLDFDDYKFQIPENEKPRKQKQPSWRSTQMMSSRYTPLDSLEDSLEI